MTPNAAQHRGPNKEPYRRLAEINRAITTSLDFDQVLNLIVENAAQLVDASACLLLLDDDEQQLQIRASIGIDESLAKSFVGRMEEDLIKDLHRTLGLKSTNSLASVPIIAKHALNGLLVIARDRSLGEEEQWQLSALADQAAIALRNARLYEMELAQAKRERDKTLEALRSSNSRINSILESMTDLFYRLDREWRFTDVNGQTEARFKKSRSELVGRVIWEVFPMAKESLLYSYFHKAVEEMVPVNFEFPCKIAEGAWFEAHGYPSSTGLTVYLRAITVRKEAEVTRHLLASIVESSDDAIISKTLNGIITSWNQGAERIFGYTAEEAIGQPATLLMPEERYNEEPTILARIRSGRSVDHYETVRRHKDGTLLDISLSVSPIRDDRGVIVGASKIARDITLHKEARKEISFQARLLNTVEQAVIATDLEGRVIFWNAFAEALYGWSVLEAMGSNVVDLVPAVDSRQKAEEIFARLREGESWSGELLVQRRDGSQFPAMITDSPILNEKGELIGVVGVSVDITDVKRAEEERTKLLAREQLARAEAEAANCLKDEFLATLSHELRNPLNVVIGYSEILRRSDDSRNPGFITKAAEVIRRNALAQSQLVSDLLDLSRLQMGKIAISRQPVALSTIISDALETVRAEAAVKSISLNINVGQDPLIVDGDPVRLGQIVWNLLNNAVKFTMPGGQITISLTEDNGDARLIVEDTGQGIAPEFLPHVFEIFRQADASSSRRQGGLGIGLALVKQLAELHGGRVSAESDGAGKGARFTVWLPLRELEGSATLSEEKESTGALNKKLILVVDDSRETTDMLSRLLQMEGAFVKTARGGEEALAVSQGKNFDLVISDISMPEMDGYQLLQKLRALPEMSNVPALALTGYGRRSDIERAHQEGFAQHLTKPLDINKLLQVVKDLTSKAGK
jgi:PAS domain S-box-containing protein